jgi:hypothetical protein
MAEHEDEFAAPRIVGAVPPRPTRENKAVTAAFASVDERIAAFKEGNSNG